MTHVLSPATVSWMRSRLRAESVDVNRGVISSGDLVWSIDPGPAGLAIGALKERGDPPVEHLRGLPEYVERWFVWSTSNMAPGRNGFDDDLQAPFWTPAPGGPLAVRPIADRKVEVLEGGRIVATFTWAGHPTKFTHYGYLPVELLLEQIDLPPEESVFHLRPMRRSYDKWWIRKNRDAPERIRSWAVDQLARRAATTTNGMEDDR